MTEVLIKNSSNVLKALIPSKNLHESNHLLEVGVTRVQNKASALHQLLEGSVAKANNT